jgi:hypothetical protein
MWAATVGANAKRFKLYQLLLGSAVAPASQASEFAVRRISARGTQNASFTPNPLDPADGAAQFTFDTGWAVNPTVTASSDMLNPSMNQQATFQWQVPQGYELIVPGTAGAGLALMSQSTTAAVAYMEQGWFEE